MQVITSPTKEEAGQKAAERGTEYIRKALDERGEAFIVLATGASQFDMLEELVQEDIDWSRVTAFHLDEYIGLPEDHPASFHRYLRERFVEKIRTPVRAFHFIDAEQDPRDECDRLRSLIEPVTINVTFLGIGENGHLAFNDPPADFDTEAPYLVVGLDDACRWQQINEGWFGELGAVPTHAISMSIRQIMKSETIICTVPEARKATAVENALLGLVTPEVPASMLKMHSDCHVFLDKDSSVGLRKTRH